MSTYIEVFRAVGYPIAGEASHHISAGWQGDVGDDVAEAVVRAGVGTVLRPLEQFESREAFDAWQENRRTSKERLAREPALSLVQLEALRPIEWPDGSSVPRGWTGLVAVDAADALIAAGAGLRSDTKPSVALVNGIDLLCEWETARAAQRAAAASLPSVRIVYGDAGISIAQVS